MYKRCFVTEEVAMEPQIWDSVSDVSTVAEGSATLFDQPQDTLILHSFCMADAGDFQFVGD